MDALALTADEGRDIAAISCGELLITLIRRFPNEETL